MFSFPSLRFDFYLFSLKVGSVMRYFGLEEPDYSEITHEFWYKLPLCLEYIRFLQKKHFQKVKQGANTPAASGSSDN